MRDKRGSGYAKILTSPKPTQTQPTINPLKDPMVLTPGKSPAPKKSKAVKKSLFPKTNRQAFDDFCQICQKSGSSSTNIWLACSGECSRWFHYLCVDEFKT